MPAVCRPRLRPFGLGTHDVSQHPLIGGGAHGERADLADEGGVARSFELAQGEEPFQRVIDP
jgi:hypothetical protein